MSNRLKFEEAGLGRLPADLQRLGFTDYESRMYIQLLQMNPATAYELSKVTGVPRANAYHALESLGRKEAVQPVSRDPVRYVPVPPDVLLEGIASSTQRLCERLANELGALRADDETHHVWTISGAAAVDERIRQLIATARHSIWIKAEASALQRHEEQLRHAGERGIAMLLILFGDDPERFRYSDRVAVHLHEGNGRMIGTADNLFTLAVDHEAVLTANVRGEIQAAYTRNQPLVVTAESLIRHDYYMARIMENVGDELEGLFGPHLRTLRESCYTAEQLERFRRQLEIRAA